MTSHNSPKQLQHQQQLQHLPQHQPVHPLTPPTSHHAPPSLTSASELLLLAQDVVSHGVAATAGLFLRNKNKKQPQKETETETENKNETETKTANEDGNESGVQSRKYGGDESGRTEGVNANSRASTSHDTTTGVFPHSINPIGPPTHRGLNLNLNPIPSGSEKVLSPTTKRNKPNKEYDEGEDVIDDEMEAMLEILDE
ncbi:hypothetical protein HDU85_007768 [Gaertneriomyces sp. JEL0708]|nr:hypothetical protein HDU85_007768 [Gaertneriomyces sp. JEL0708]